MSNKINIPLESLQDHSISNVFDSSFTYLSDVRKVFGKKIMFCNREGSELKPIVSLSVSHIPLHVESFDQIEEVYNIASVDSSCISIGETEDGAIYSVKSGVSMYNGSRPKSYQIYGPYVVYVDEEVIRQIYKSHPLKEKLVKLVTLDHNYAKNLVRVIVERDILKYLALNLNKSIVLVDGSLKSSIFEVDGCTLKEILKLSKEKNNMLLGISKSSKLKFIRRVASYLEILNYAPVKVDVHHVVDNLISRLEGHIFVAKFKKYGFAFRVDVPYDSILEVDELLGRVLWNDAFRHGYPESLVMAHNLSTFNYVEQICVKSALTRSLNITEVPANNLRVALLGGLKFQGGAAAR